MIRIRLFVTYAVVLLLVYAPYSFSEEIEYDDSSSGYAVENDDDINNAFIEPNDSSDSNESLNADSDDNIQTIKPRKHFDNYSSAYSDRLPSKIPAPGERVIVVDPKIHAWGAYNANGILLRAGLASAGSKWCADLERPCRTKAGVFRINSLGSRDCVSSRYPIDVGGAPMPYCMYFNGNQALHGSNEVAEANISHGCVRMNVQDAQWLRFEFAQVGTKVIIKSY